MAAEALGADKLVERSKQYRVVHVDGQLRFGKTLRRDYMGRPGTVSKDNKQKTHVRQKTYRTRKGGGIKWQRIQGACETLFSSGCCVWSSLYTDNRESFKKDARRLQALPRGPVKRRYMEKNGKRLRSSSRIPPTADVQGRGKAAGTVK